MRNSVLHLTTNKRVCRTPGCQQTPEPKDPYCLKCQLAGKAPDQVRKRR